MYMYPTAAVIFARLCFVSFPPCLLNICDSIQHATDENEKILLNLKGKEGERSKIKLLRQEGRKRASLMFSCDSFGYLSQHRHCAFGLCLSKTGEGEKGFSSISSPSLSPPPSSSPPLLFKPNKQTWPIKIIDGNGSQKFKDLHRGLNKKKTKKSKRRLIRSQIQISFHFPSTKTNARKEIEPAANLEPPYRIHTCVFDGRQDSI